MDSFTGRTLIATIVFLDIVEYSKTSVDRQMKMKDDLNRAISLAIGGIGESERVVLDTGDGAALCLLGDPEDALFAATAINNAMAEHRDVSLRSGINLGPVKLVVDLNGQRNVVGDGINVAQRVMSFAEPGEVLISRSFYEVVSRLRDDQEFLFRFLGTKKDKHIREHQIYAVGVRVPAGGRPAIEALEIEHDLSGDGLLEDTELRTTVIDEELSRASEVELTRYIGPVARVLVRRAVEKSRSLEEFRTAIAETILDPADRDSFLGAFGSKGEVAEASAPAPVSVEPAWRLDDQEADRVVRLLANELGPLARVLVARAAKKATSRQGFYRHLVEGIDDRDARMRFLDGLGRLGI